MIIGILGPDPFGGWLRDAVEGERSNGRGIVVRQLTRIDRGDECHVVFIARSEMAALPRILAALAGRPVLTVSNIPDLARLGGMVEFVDERARIPFRINHLRAKSAALEISAKLLRPAEVITTGPRSLPGRVD